MCLDNSDDCLVVSCYMERFAMTNSVQNITALLGANVKSLVSYYTRPHETSSPIGERNQGKERANKERCLSVLLTFSPRAHVLRTSAVKGRLGTSHGLVERWK